MAARSPESLNCPFDEIQQAIEACTAAGCPAQQCYDYTPPTPTCTVSSSATRSVSPFLLPFSDCKQLNVGVCQCTWETGSVYTCGCSSAQSVIVSCCFHHTTTVRSSQPYCPPGVLSECLTAQQQCYNGGGDTCSCFAKYIQCLGQGFCAYEYVASQIQQCEYECSQAECTDGVVSGSTARSSLRGDK